MAKVTLKLGIIGMSEGNGHPYSWSSIFNGYSREDMEQCGFPVIPRYLEQQDWPSAAIQNCRVVTVLTQNKSISTKIAKACLIPHISDSIEDLIPLVDAVLLARDDSENHLFYSTPVLEAGKPIFIDKPIAVCRADLDAIYDRERYSGQVFTCSALRYARELSLTKDDCQQLGEIREIVASTPKSWEKYSVHIIEPVLQMLPEGDVPVRWSRSGSDESAGAVSRLKVDWSSGVVTTFCALGEQQVPISISVRGVKSQIDLEFRDTFPAFKAALSDFVAGVRAASVRSPKDFNYGVVDIIEKGMAS